MFFVNHGTGRKQLTLRNSCQQTPTLDSLPTKSGTILKSNLKRHGMVLNKNTHSSVLTPNSPCGLSDGQTMVTLDHKDLTTAQLVPTFASVVSFLMHTTRLACTLASRFLALMPRSCLDSGSTKLALAKASPSVTTCGCLATC